MQRTTAMLCNVPRERATEVSTNGDISSLYSYVSIVSKLTTTAVSEDLTVY